MRPAAVLAVDPLTAGAVLLATAATDAVYVTFSSAVAARKRVPAATWSSVTRSSGPRKIGFMSDSPPLDPGWVPARP